MERRRAMAVAATISLVSASGIVTGVSLWTAGGQSIVVETVGTDEAPTTAAQSAAAPEPVIVTQRRDVYDRIVVPRKTSLPASADEPSPTPSPSAPPATTTPTTRPPKAPAPTTSTTAPRSTTTTRPPGVPKDWPADKPIPPMPPDCEDPKLEDNGQWNCQD